MSKNTSPIKPLLGGLVAGCVLGAVVTSGFFLTQNKSKPQDLSQATGMPYFEVDGTVYTTTGLPGAAQGTYNTLEERIFEAKRDFAKELALQIALAKDSGVDLTKGILPPLNTLLTPTAVSDAEAQKVYDEVVAMRGIQAVGGQPFESVKAQIIAQMQQQKTVEAAQGKLASLEEGGRIKVLLQAPASPQLDLNVSAYPWRGNEKAPYVLVTVADYLCPHCRDAEPILEKIASEFGDKVKFISVSYPLDPQGLSGTLAKGAYCAQQQSNDGFWKYNSEAFRVPMDNIKATGSDATKEFQATTVDVAKKVGLDVPAFEACLTSQAAEQYLAKPAQDFTADKGFSGTPAFYLNGRPLKVNKDQLESSLKEALSSEKSS